MELVLEKAARKGLDRMPAKAADALLRRFKTIAMDPFAPHANVVRMQGEKGRVSASSGRLACRLPDREASQ